MNEETIYIVGSRRAGKTEQLIKWATEWVVAEEGQQGEVRVIVTWSQTARQDILSRAREIIPTWPDWRVVTYDDLDQGRLRGKNNIRLGLDDIEARFPQVGYMVGVVTATTDQIINLDAGERYVAEGELTNFVGFSAQ